MTPSGAQVPLAQVADIRTVTGPSMIRNENGLLVGYVYVDITGRDVGGYVDDAKRAVAAAVKLPSGYALEWSGQYENMQRVTDRLDRLVANALHQPPDLIPAGRCQPVPPSLRAESSPPR
jgi:Cu(I)/Ag(I) efflux system membrane protein CusA/SilA